MIFTGLFFLVYSAYMRPKAKLVYFSTEESQLSITSFVLETAKYKVFKASTGSEVLKHVTEHRVNLVIIDVGVYLFTTNEIARRIKSISPYTPVMLIGELRSDFIHSADAILDKKISTRELLERVKIMSARKRGPRKGSHHRVPEPALA